MADSSAAGLVLEPQQFLVAASAGCVEADAGVSPGYECALQPNEFITYPDGGSTAEPAVSIGSLGGGLAGSGKRDGATDDQIVQCAAAGGVIEAC